MASSKHLSLVRQDRSVSCHKWITSIVDFSLYVKKKDHGIVIIIIYVDDLIIIGDSDADIFDLKKLLKQKFEMKDLGELCYFLSIEVI